MNLCFTDDDIICQLVYAKHFMVECFFFLCWKSRDYARRSTEIVMTFTLYNWYSCCRIFICDTKQIFQLFDEQINRDKHEIVWKIVVRFRFLPKIKYFNINTQTQAVCRVYQMTAYIHKSKSFEHFLFEHVRVYMQWRQNYLSQVAWNVLKQLTIDDAFSNGRMYNFLHFASQK